MFLPRLSHPFIHYHYFRLSLVFGASDEQIIFFRVLHIFHLINPFITFIQSQLQLQSFRHFDKPDTPPFFYLDLQMKYIFNRYNTLLLRRPLITNMITTGLLVGGGDALAQFLFPNNDNNNLEQQPFDYLRNLRAIIYGSLIFAPIGDKWYKFLNTKVVWTRNAQKPQYQLSMSTLLRVMVDQLVFAPFIGIPLYYSSMTILENRQPFLDNIIDKFNTSWWITLKSNWLVWPLFQFFNFYLLPVQFRLLAVNIISIGWNTYLSYVMHSQK